MPNDPLSRPQPVGGGDKAQRLHKVLARAGVASRRGAEQLIAEGRVVVDGRLVVEQGMQVDPATAVVEVDGKRVAVDDRHATYLLNKPKGVVTAMSDQRERCVGDLLREQPDLPAGLFHVGRLDADTTGLLLVSNDGELAHRLAHPSYEIPKTYLATVRGAVGKGALDALRRGVSLEDGPARADAVAVKGEARPAPLRKAQTGHASGGARSVVEITLHEGRNRIVRRMFDAVGHPVVELARLRIGPIRLGGLQAGALRALAPEEVGALWAAVDQKAVRE
ncbi:pseudouridine synthase [Segniliparus rugosus]|uniref:Pseudouridine synthase n=1 Tax=Segniliparus rugosus (strain ATCC BAA-974 / DSM 45345 / CCUG 50838 / CIP 108380 / JCM 13579 / CDC 945) TaxID=679197 RepID=E5XNH3_SEGRC|nr:pseudouridine synthase [Segniliparus rugosus]EFV14085.1 pseudouridine synthase [Segniliparus rugosus ATCC BAA-974]